MLDYFLHAYFADAMLLISFAAFLFCCAYMRVAMRMLVYAAPWRLCVNACAPCFELIAPPLLIIDALCCCLLFTRAACLRDDYVACRYAVV